MSRTKTRLWLLCALAPALLAVACDDDDDVVTPDGAVADAAPADAAPRDTAVGVDAPPRDTAVGVDAAPRDTAAAPDAAPGPGDAAVAAARIRVVHAAADAPAVDIYARGAAMPAVRGLAYGQASPYLELPAGTYAFEVRAAGAAATSAPAFTTPELALGAGARVTAVAAGSLASMNADDRFRVLPLVEGFQAPAAGAVRVRVVHAAPDAPTVAIDIGADGMPEIPSLARFADTGPAGVDLPAGQALAIAVWAGMPLAKVTQFTTPALPAGAELFVIAAGSLTRHPREATGFSLLAVGPTAAIGRLKQDPTVFALHASPDAPAVDVFAGAAQLVENLAFGALSAPIQVAPNDGVTLDFFATAAGTMRPMGAPAATAMTPRLEAGERYLAVATGFLSPAGGAPGFQLVALRDELLPDPARAKLRVLHASPDAPAVDVGVIANDTFTAPEPLRNLAFRMASPAEGLALDPGMLTVGVAPTGMTTPVARFPLVLTAGLRAHVVAAGALAPMMGAQGFRLLVVNAAAWPWTVAAVTPMN
jgi:hypothetical protein